MNLFSYQLKLWRGRISVAVVLISFFAFSRSPLRLVGAALQVDDDSSGIPSDVAVLLLGDFIGRGERASEVLRNGMAPRVFWGRTESGEAEKRGYVKNEADFAEDILMKSGLSIDQMIKEDSCHNGSTIDEAWCLHRFFEKHPPFPKKIALVTSWFHTRRARWIFRRIFRDDNVEVVTFLTAAAGVDGTNWWTSEESGFAVINEYIKWVYYLTHYFFDSGLTLAERD